MRCACLLALAAGLCPSQVPQAPAKPAHFIEVKLPLGLPSQSVFVRYVLNGEELGGWVQPPSGVSSFLISTTLGGRPATRIRALLYAPGCAIQAVDLRLSGLNGQQYSFFCRPLRSIPIAGALTRADRLYGREVELQAKYIARWARSFLGLRDDIVTAIPVGDVAYPSADGYFRLSIPDLSQDPLAGAADHSGEIQIWVTDKTNHKIVAQLTPAIPNDFKTRMGGLRIQSGYPPETLFVPCASNCPNHDAEGFALRPAPADACDR